jgi:precorrin-6A/cobalt-precorrin-6A reductase
MAFKVLILGGTSDGRRLAEHLSVDSRYDVLLSFAGRTQSLQLPRVPHRVGGFGGIDGLEDFLRRERFEALVDATHPFAAQISHNAARAAERARLPLVRVECPPWVPIAGDRWTMVATMDDAAESIGPARRRVLLTIGRLEIDAFRAAPHHDYLIRAVDDFALPHELRHARVIAARGPFEVPDEIALLERERVKAVVSKNSGTRATYAKIEAARRLGIPVILVQRPTLPEGAVVATADEALEWLEATQERAPSERRGE